MSRFTSAADLARAQMARGHQVRRSLRVEHEQLVEQTRRDAVKLTSGTATAKDLRREGHPYGRGPAARPGLKGKARGSRPKLPINTGKSGDLQRSLRVFRRTGAGGTVYYRMQFMSGHARYVLSIGGTETMVARGFWPEIRRRYLQRRGRMVVAFKRANRR